MFLTLVIILIIFYLYNQYNFYVSSQNQSKIKTLVRSCARWALASLQDTSPLVAVLHANYAAGYLWALNEIFTDYEIKQTTGLNIITFSQKITDIQDVATRRLAKTCPEFSKNLDISLLKTAGEI